MKHQKEWHTCDRCGEKISHRKRNEMKYTGFGKYSIPYPIFEDGDVVGEIEKIEKHRIFPGTKVLELCPKCRKDFERFMRNEENTK